MLSIDKKDNTITIPLNSDSIEEIINDTMELIIRVYDSLREQPNFAKMYLEDVRELLNNPSAVLSILFDILGDEGKCVIN